jgi:hypothetical protein
MSETNAIVAVQPTFNLQDTLKLGEVLARSKRFADDVSPEQAVVKVLAGQELGFGPIASMTGIYVIKGRVTVSANMMAQAVKRSTKYDYRIAQMDDTVCEIAFFETGQELGRSVFTLEDARKAGTQNIDKFPRNMLFARAMSNGVKWYCPDVFNTGVYTPEELGVPVDGEGEIIDITPTPATPAPHWIKDDATRKRFWAWTDGQTLTRDQVHEALGVEHIEDYEGTKADAMKAINEWIVAQDYEDSAEEPITFDEAVTDLYGDTENIVPPGAS